MHWYTRILKAGWVLIALTAWVPQGVAQIELGDDVKMNMNGTLGFGYGGSYGAFGQSSRSLNFNGNGTLSGSYYNPNFLSFNVQPYYNRSQNNADTQSIFDESGVTASANIFSGSRFPGFISYGKNFNGSGEFGIPGIAGLTTQGLAAKPTEEESSVTALLAGISSPPMSSHSSRTQRLAWVGGKRVARRLSR